MASKGKIVIGIFGLIIMITGIIWFVSSVSKLGSDLVEAENKKAVCGNWKADLDKQKIKLDQMDFSEQWVTLLEKYNIDLADYSRGCL